MRGRHVAKDVEPSKEGKGIARRAWESYDRAARKALTPVFHPVGVHVAVDALGFWLAWQLHGGFEGLLELGMPRRTIYFNIKKFRAAYGVHPDEWECPGVTVDLDQYRSGGKGRG
jgi:hypothetical protein